MQYPFIAYLPFLVVYLLLIFMGHSDQMHGDEGRYVMFATNLLDGFYSPKDNFNLWNGPGYPIFLMPFLALGLPLIGITLANGFLYYFSVILLFKTVQKITNTTFAAIIGFCWAAYFVAYQELPAILSEPLTIFIIAAIIYLLTKLKEEKSYKYTILLGIAIGYLVLTKIIFGYVLLALWALFLILQIITSIRSYRQGMPCLYEGTPQLLISLSIALLCIAPYLLYTYSLTGKVFYLGNSGGMSLYWMSTPHPGEFGDWNNKDFDANCFSALQPCNASQFAKNHKENFDYIYQFEGVERDEKFKEVAIKNIKTYPTKYIKNCIANQGRLWFGFPYSYLYQRDSTLIRILPNMLLLSIFLLTLVLWVFNLKHIPIEIHFLLLFLLLYLFLSTLVSAFPRNLYVIVPVILFLFAYVAHRSIKINWSFDQSS